MSDFLLELRSEEIPARMQAGARGELEKLFRDALAANGVMPGEVIVWSTPRRLVLLIRDLPHATPVVEEEIKGPRTNAPPQALDGFLRKTGLTKDALAERDGVWFATKSAGGVAIENALATAIDLTVSNFSWPKSMRWGDSSIRTDSMRWVRPLHGIVALLDGAIVRCEIDGFVAGRETRGYRFHAPGSIMVESAATYADQLRAAHVIVDHREREALIRDGARGAAAAAGLELVEDEGLVAENAGLTEWPVPLLGRFDPAFLDVPPEVIRLTARVNQKYFVCRDGAGALANAFVCTANIAAADGGAGVVEGNRKVLAARLADARFFWDQDRRVPLAEMGKQLERITFHEKLGTVADKVARVAKLAEWLASEGIVPGCDPALARQAAELCKADLVSAMVGEFPELQGVMGGYYARAEGLPDAVADAIRDHYKPVGQGDEVPTAPVTVAVSLADKLDTLSQFFAIFQRPSGSKDPLALRRAAISVINIVMTLSLRLSIRRVLTDNMGERILEIFSSYLIDQYIQDTSAIQRFDIPFKTGEFSELLRSRMERDFKGQLPEINREISWNLTDLVNLFAERLKVQQREAGVRHDLIDAVFALGGEDDLVRLLARVKALQAFIGTAEGANLLAAYKRAANILKKEAVTPAQTGVQEEGTAPAALDSGLRRNDGEPAEIALTHALAAATPRAASAVVAEDFTAAMAALATLRAPIDRFFDRVIVNDADPAKRAARLSLLASFRDAVHQVADFSRIEG